MNDQQVETMNMNQFFKTHFAILFNRNSQRFEVILTEDCDDKDLIKCYFNLQYLIYSKDFNQFVISSWVDIDQLEATTSKLYEDFLFKTQTVGLGCHSSEILD